MSAKFALPVLGLLVAALTSHAQTSTGQTTVRVSVSSAGAQANAASFTPSISGGGSVAFASRASNLVTETVTGATDIFTRTSASTRLMSVATTDAQGNSHSVTPAISADGEVVAFASVADNLVSGDSNGTSDVFVRTPGSTTRVSVASSGAQGNGPSLSPSTSADGRLVAFSSLATNLVSGDSNGRADIFVRDRAAGTTTRVSLRTDGAQVNGHSGFPSISADGRWVAFISSASNLVAGDTNGVADVFVHDRLTGTTTRASVRSDGMQANNFSFFPAISGDGRVVAFGSFATNLIVGDANGVSDVFVHELSSGTTRRVSVASNGTAGNGHSTSSAPAISADGTLVAFGSYASNLVPGDTNADSDVFLNDSISATTTRVSVATDGAQASGASTAPSLSPDGRYVAFNSTAPNLVAGDTNGAMDVFVRDRGSAGTGDLYSHGGDLAIFDARDLDAIVLNRIVPFPTIRGEGIAFDSRGNLLVGVGGTGEPGGLDVYDRNLNLIGHADVDDPISDRTLFLAVRSSQVFACNPVGAPFDRLFVFDVSDPLDPRNTNIVDIPGSDQHRNGCRGLAFDPAGNLWVTSSGRLNKLSVDAVGNPTLLQQLLPGGNPYDVAFEPATGRLFYTAVNDNFIGVLDPAEPSVRLATIINVCDHASNSPGPVAFASSGDMFVACTNNFGATADMVAIPGDALIGLSGTVDASTLGKVRVESALNGAGDLAFQPIR